MAAAGAEGGRFPAPHDADKFRSRLAASKLNRARMARRIRILIYF